MKAEPRRTCASCGNEFSGAIEFCPVCMLRKGLAAGVASIIFVTGHGGIPMSVQAMKAGAVEFLTKPFRDQTLLDAIRQAIERDRLARQQRARNADLRRRYESLGSREREVFKCVVSGIPNKQIADELGATERTIKFHRGHIMRKMLVRSVAELVRMAEALGIAGQED